MRDNFRFLSNENKGESLSLSVQSNCYKLIRHIIENRSYNTTLYPCNYEFEGHGYHVRSFTIDIEVINGVPTSVYHCVVSHRHYTIDVIIRENE